MAIIEEALDKLNPSEKKIHELLKEFDEDTVMGYAIKRSSYKDMTKEEMEYINDIYEQGTTIFDINVFSRSHKLRLLSQKEKAEINLLIDQKFNKPTRDSEESRYFTDKAREVAELEYRIVAMVALSLIEIAGDNFDKLVLEKYELDRSKLTPVKKIEYLELLPSPLIKMIYDKYLELENRIYEIFLYEAIRKK